MNIQVDPTRSNLAFAMLNSKIRPRAVVGYTLIFSPQSSTLSDHLAQMQDEHMYSRGCGRRWKDGLGLLDSSMRMLCNDVAHRNSRKSVPYVKKIDL